MDEMSYTTNEYSNPSEQEKVPLQNNISFNPNKNSNDMDVDVDIDDDDDDDHEENGVQRIVNDEYQDDNGDYSDYGSTQKYPKKRKLKSMLSSYEFGPRIPEEASASARIGARNSVADWSEHETFILLGAWGDKYLLQRGQKILRSEEWQEVAERVSQESQNDKTDCQCRNRLDTLKKKYKKEKAKTMDNGSFVSKWAYFERMDSLLSSSSPETGLSSALDSGNGLDTMRDGPGNLDSEVEEDSEGLPPKRRKIRKDSFKLLANCIEKFSKIYEKIEYRKQQQMVELEKMRMDYLRDLDLQKRQILQKAQVEIARIHQVDGEENDVSC